MKFFQFAIAFATIAAAGCAVRHPVMPAALSQYQPPLGVSRWSTFGENSTERQVRMALRSLPDFTVFDYVAYRVDYDRVTLYGSVIDPWLREDAESVVRSLCSVDHVHNLIQYLPNSPQDVRVRQRLFGAIYGDRILARYAYAGGGAIRIVEGGGSVILEGQVATEADRMRAAQIASRVPGVVHTSRAICK